MAAYDANVTGCWSKIVNNNNYSVVESARNVQRLPTSFLRTNGNENRHFPDVGKCKYTNHNVRAQVDDTNTCCKNMADHVATLNKVIELLINDLNEIKTENSELRKMCQKTELEKQNIWQTQVSGVRPKHRIYQSAKYDFPLKN